MATYEEAVMKMGTIDAREAGIRPYSNFGQEEFDDLVEFPMPALGRRKKTMGPYDDFGVPDIEDQEEFNEAGYDSDYDPVMGEDGGFDGY